VRHAGTALLLFLVAAVRARIRAGRAATRGERREYGSGQNEMVVEII
jgi:hypothetical protein